MGEKFSPDLHTGTGNFSIPISVPPGRNGFQPSLTLGYSTGSGNGPFGLGWNLGIPGVSRLTSKGIPRYHNDPSAGDADIFVLSGAEDLVPVEIAGGHVPAGDHVRYRPRTEGLFAQITRHRDTHTDHWDVRSKDGLVSYYGTPGQRHSDPAVNFDPAGQDQAKIFAWRLTSTEDPFGNRIEYEYERDQAIDRSRHFDQLYLKHIRYTEYGEGANRQFLTSVTFEYQDRSDAFSEYRAGYEIRTRKRCKRIVVRSHPAAEQKILVRAYEFVYLDEVATTAELPPNGVSLLKQVNVIGYDDAGTPHQEMPPLEFGYSRFTPHSRKFIALEGRGLPVTSLTDPDLELVDLFGHGLPDIVELGGTVRYWRNLGNGRFDMPRSFSEAPSSWKLSDVGVQILDANGDGRADLLVTTADIAGYYPLDFRGKFSRKSFQRYQQAPSFNLEDPEVRLIDLTGDGVSDVLRAGTTFECYFNHPKDGWLPGNTRRVQRKGLEDFPDVNFSDPRVKFADLSGDGLQDIALVHRGRIDYWPNLGHGQWGRRITMAIPELLLVDFDPQRVLLGDVDGDGLADLIYVTDREIKLWINRSGAAWHAPVTVRGTPAVNSMVSVRLTDLLGSGVGGILWTREADGSGRPSHFFLDLTGGNKPYLLDRMDNNMGAVTEVNYATSTKYYLRDYAIPANRWRTTLPFPVQVVEHVKVTDELSGGVLTTEYRYHHGYWDGVEREFRGFGMVEQVDTEVFNSYAGRAIEGRGDYLNHLLRQQNYAPPMLTRTWFHQGPVDPADDGHWAEYDGSPEYWPGDRNLLAHTQNANSFIHPLAPELQRDALRTLRGSILRSELYALDGSALQERPYTVTEQAYDLREVDAPDAGSRRRHIFFPHSVAQRTTQWERGNDPQTQFAYTADYDDVGQPRRQIAIACPRGWREMDDAPDAGYLATLSHTEYAGNAPEGLYLRDRVARSRSFEIRKTVHKKVTELELLTESDLSLHLIGESLNYYDGDAFTGLLLGQLGRYGAVVRTESLVMTWTHVQTAYGTAIPPYLTPASSFTPVADYPAQFVASMPTLAGYVYRTASTNNSEGYFVTTGKRCDFHTVSGTGRGLTLAQRDPLGRESTIDYDDYQLLPKQITGPTGLTTQAEYDYRVLQPQRVIDPNGNVSEVAYSPTGLVTHTWVRGKPGRNEGDISEASTQMEYGLRAFYESKRANPANPQPVYARAIRRVFHDSDPEDSGETIEAREYSDGFGRLLQTRTQGETVRFGDTLFGGGDAVLPSDQFAATSVPVIGVENTDPNAPNVIVSGWQRYDNKGRVIEKYEPFYDTGWDYQPHLEAQQGRHVTMYYDPRGQAIRTVNPDASEQRVIYGIPVNLEAPPLSALETGKFSPTPWEAYTYDPNDNAGRTHAGQSPHTSYVHHYNTPASIEVDALGRTIRAVVRQRAAALNGGALPAIEEHLTRSSYDIQGNLLTIRDALGRLAFEYFYDLAKRPLRTESIDAGRKMAITDAAGNPLEGRDAKGALVLHAYDALNRPTHSWASDVTGESMTLREQLRYDSDPADPDHAAAHNLLGKLYQHHDEAGVVTVAAYDFKGNILASSRQVLSDDFMLGNIRAHSGNNWALQAPRVNWAAPPANVLDTTQYKTRSAYDALNRIKWSEYPQAANGARYRLRPDYNRAGALESVDLLGPLDANDQGARQPYVQRIAYNAKGQRSLIAYGNGILTRYAYDSDTFRLTRLHSARLDTAQSTARHYQTKGAALQDIGYWYDLAGNILGMLDLTPGGGVAGNPEAQFNDGELRELMNRGDALLRCFGYDPLYRLVSATGRECKDIPSPRSWSDDARCGYDSGQHGTPTQGNAADLTALYWEEYAYDPAGNMLTLRHNQSVQHNGSVAWQTLWSRRFGMEGRTPEQWQVESAAHITGDWTDPPSNRLTHVQDRASGVPTPPSVAQSHFYDENGNMVREQGARHFEWDYADRMKVFRNQVGTSKPTTYALYLYDAGGQRVKKLVWTGSGYRTTTYLGAAFEHHAGYDKLDGSGKTENNTLHVMDDESRIALVRIGAAFKEDGAKDHPVQYHLGDHLGSSGVVVSGGGVWINREEFFPYGETSFGSFGRKRYRFTGKERDEESGLNYHGARYYSCWLARWLSTDPVVEGAGSLNLYVYCINRPTIAVDPDGRSPILLVILVGILLTPGIANAPTRTSGAIHSPQEGEIAVQMALGLAGPLLSKLIGPIGAAVFGKTASAPGLSGIAARGVTGAGVYSAVGFGSGIAVQGAHDLTHSHSLSTAGDYFSAGFFSAASQLPFGALVGSLAPRNAFLSLTPEEGYVLGQAMAMRSQMQLASKSKTPAKVGAAYDGLGGPANETGGTLVTGGSGEKLPLYDRVKVPDSLVSGPSGAKIPVNQCCEPALATKMLAAGGDPNKSIFAIVDQSSGAPAARCANCCAYAPSGATYVADKLAARSAAAANLTSTLSSTVGPPGGQAQSEVHQ
jgi:RHS repeat-associated protein